MSTLTDRVNGHYTKVNGPPMHTFRDSGIAVKLHKLGPTVSRAIVLAVREELAAEKPEPPIVQVDYGNGPVSEPNPGDPGYVVRLTEWENKVNRLSNDRFFRVACLLGVEVSINDTERAQIERTKRVLRLAGKVDWRDDPELTPEENDQIFYVSYIACASPEDLSEFYQAIATRSQPTEAAVQQHKDSFPSDV